MMVKPTDAFDKLGRQCLINKTMIHHNDIYSKIKAIPNKRGLILGTSGRSGKLGGVCAM